MDPRQRRERKKKGSLLSIKKGMVRSLCNFQYVSHLPLLLAPITEKGHGDDDADEEKER